MALDFNAVLSDKTKYPDTIEIPIGDEKVSLGDLRTLTQGQQAALADQINSYKTREREVTELASKAAEVISRAEAATKAEEKPVRQPNEWDQLYDTDPSYAPVRTRLSAYEEKLTKAQEKLDAQQAALEKAAMVFAKRMWRDDYKEAGERLKGDKYAQWRDIDKLANYAAQRGLIDPESGIPSVSRAIEDLTREDELARLREEAKQEGIRQGRLEARMGAMQRPTSAAGPQPGSGDFALDPAKNFEDLGDKAMLDPATREMLAQLADFNPEDFQKQ